MDDRFKLFLEKADLLKEQGKFDLAIASYLDAIKLDLNNYEAYHHLGECLVQQKKLLESVGFFRHALHINPEFIWSHHCLGQALLWLERWDEAIVCFEAAIELNPNLAIFYHQLAIALNKKGLLESAIYNYQKTITLDPTLDTAYFELGQIFQKQSKYNDAIDCYEKALIINPDFKPSYQVLEHIPTQPEELDRLIICYKNIVKEKPHIFLAWGNLGDALTTKGELSEAIKCYETACYQKAIISQPQLASIYTKEKKKLAPDYIIIGAGKCGTTSLHGYLGQHPNILLPHNKELNFFHRHFEKTVDWYLAHFPSLADRDDFFTGESSPGYFHSPNVDKRIFDLFPQTKLILLLRNPIDRAVSWYYHALRHGEEKRSLETAIDSEMSKLDGLKDERLVHRPGTLGEGLYVYKIKRWLSIFPREQLLILKSEDFYSNTAKIMDRVFTFLNIPTYKSMNYPKYNSGSYSEMDENLRTKLREFYQPHNDKLEAYLGEKFNWNY